MAINPDGTKTCCRCHASKPVSEFYPYKRRTGDGFTARCIVCAKAAAIEWQKAHPDRKTASDRKQAAKKSARAAADPVYREKRAESVRRWMKAHPEYLRRYQQEYKERDPERRRQQNQCAANKKRALRMGLESDFTWDDWKQVLAAFENRCAFCGAENAMLDIEHLEALSKGGHNVRGNIVPSCRPCNAQKSHRSLAQFCAVRNMDEAELRNRVKQVLGLTE